MTDRSRFTTALVLAFAGTWVTTALAEGEPPGAAVPPAVKPGAAPAPTPAPAASAAAPEAAPAAPAPAAAASGDDEDDDAAHDSDASPAAPPGDAAAPGVLDARKPAPGPVVLERPNPNSIDDGKMGSHQQHFLVSIGWRQAWVANSGLDPFSENNAVPQFSLSAGRTLLADGNLSLVALVLWDIGVLESTARGAKTELAVNRLTLGAEGRYHFLRRLYAFGRVAPGALNWSASVEDGLSGLNQTDSAWTFAGDLSAGAMFEFAGDNRGASTRPRAWLGFDGGYGWAGSSKVNLKPEDEAQAPVRSEPLALGDLAIRGPFLRFSVSGTY